MRFASHARTSFLAPVLIACSGVACGSRSGLFVPAGEGDGGGRERTSDAAVEPTLPATLFLGDCFGSAPPPVYLFTDEVPPALFAFSPSTGAFTPLPPAACPAGPAAPVALAVDRSGTAYLLLAGNTGTRTLNRISLATGACAPLSLGATPANQPGGALTFAENSDGKGETLYVLTRNGVLPLSAVNLATIDPGTAATLQVGQLGLLDPAPKPSTIPSLVGTGGGELFALYPEPGAPVIARVDRVSGRATAQWMPAGVRGSVSGFAFWGGDFYLFQWVGVTEVLRFRPRDGSLLAVARMTQATKHVGGAATTTCSPLR